MILVIEIGYDEVRQAVSIGVAGIRTHARFGDSVLVVRHLGVDRDVLKSTVVLVDEKQVGRSVSRDEQIGPAVVVNVDGDNTERSVPQAFPNQIANSRR